VEKGMAAKVVPVSKMAMARSSAVAMGCSQQKGLDDEDDNPLLLLSHNDQAEKKRSGEGAALTMLQEAEGFFNLPWKDYVSVYLLFIYCFCKLFLMHLCKCFWNCFCSLFSKKISNHLSFSLSPYSLIMKVIKMSS
jgi:hypothetical protein